MAAVAGDQTGFAIGHRGGAAQLARVGLDATPATVMPKAGEKLAANGIGAVCFSRWMFSPLRPYVNLAAGAVGLRWTRFTLAGVLGEALWVCASVFAGYFFASNIGDLAGIAPSMIGFLAAGSIAVGPGTWLWRSARARQITTPVA